MTGCMLVIIIYYDYRLMDAFVVVTTNRRILGCPADVFTEARRWNIAHGFIEAPRGIFRTLEIHTWIQAQGTSY
jgi:hypothetical protein